MLKYGELTPMEPRSAKEPFQSKDHLFQVKWDGVRMISFVEDGQVRLQNRKLRPRTHVYPDFQNLHQWLKADQIILDGEMIVLANGKPSFGGILKRDLKTDPAGIQVAARRIPATYVAFDILALNGEDLTGHPFTRRMEILREVATPNDHFQVIEDFTDGVSLFKVIEAQEMEGIIAKTKDGLYLPGVKSDNWLKIKTKKDLIGVVGGYTIKERRLSSLLMGAYLDDQLRYIGNVATGLTANDIKILTTYLQELKCEHPAFINPPRLYGVETHWIKPVLTAKVEFMEWTGFYQMRAPVILGFTKDKPEECQLV